MRLLIKKYTIVGLLTAFVLFSFQCFVFAEEVEEAPILTTPVTESTGTTQSIIVQVDNSELVAVMTQTNEKLEQVEKHLLTLVYIISAFFFWQVIKIIYNLIAGVFLGGL